MKLQHQLRWIAALLAVGTVVRVGSAATLEELWAALGSKESPETAIAAEKALAARGEEAVKFIVQKLVSGPDDKEVAQLVKQLDDDKFKVREAAQEKLLGMGIPVERSLQQALDKTDSAEVATRLQDMLTKLKTMKRPGREEDQRQFCGLRIVITAGLSAEESLQQIAEKGTWESTRREATAVLDRRAFASIGEAITSTVNAAKAGATAEEVAAQEMKIRVRIKAAHLEEWDALTLQLKRLEVVTKAMGERKALEATLAADPKDAKAREALVLVMMVELENGAGAAKVAEGGPLEASLKQAATLAGRSTEKLTAAERGELASFLITTAQLSTGARKVMALEQAGTLLALSLADANVAWNDRVRITADLAGVQAALDSLNAGESGWANALLDARLDKDVVAGEWVREKGGLAVSVGEFSVMNLHAKMPANYELKVRLTRRDGTEGIFVGFPVGKARANLNIGGWSNTMTGLETIGGKGVDEADETLKHAEGIDNGIAYEYVVRVTVKPDKVTINVTENGKQLSKWEGKEEDLSCHEGWHPDKQSGITLGAHQSEVLFKYVRVRKIAAE